MRTTVVLLLTGLAAPVLAMAGDVPPPADQIALAVLAAPEEWRAGAGVWGFDENRKLVNLRKATNDLVCFGDDPAKEEIRAECVPKDVEYWQLRRWQLSAQGLRAGKTLWAEVESGKLKKPPSGWTVHILAGSSFDVRTDKIADYKLRWVVIMPNATPASTGLPAEESVDTPWLMGAGTPGAHIMVPGVTEQQ